jgi:hypothetical protein
MDVAIRCIWARRPLPGDRRPFLSLDQDLVWSAWERISIRQPLVGYPSIFPSITALNALAAKDSSLPTEATHHCYNPLSAIFIIANLSISSLFFSSLSILTNIGTLLSE